MKVYPCKRRLLSREAYKIQLIISSLTSFPDFVSVFGVNYRVAGSVPFDATGINPGFLDLMGFKTPNI